MTIKTTNLMVRGNLVGLHVIVEKFCFQLYSYQILPMCTITNIIWFISKMAIFIARKRYFLDPNTRQPIIRVKQPHFELKMSITSTLKNGRPV